MAIIDLKGTVNTEALKLIDKNLLGILNTSVTPECVRTKLKWESTSNISKLIVQSEGSDDFVELKYKAIVSTDYVSGLSAFITQPLNGSRRFSLDSNPSVVKIKSRVEDMLDEAIENVSTLYEAIVDNGAYLLYDVDVEFADKTAVLDDKIVIELVVSVNQRD